MSTITIDSVRYANIMYALQHASDRLEQIGSLFDVVHDKETNGVLKNVCIVGKDLAFETSDFLQKRKEELLETTSQIKAA